MADAADVANDLMQERLDQLLAARPARSGVSALECDSCGEDILEARRLAAPGCCRCAFCQDRFERRGR